MKFLVVGASGFIGRHILTYVQSLGYASLGTQFTTKTSKLVTFDLAKDRIEDRVGPGFFRAGEPIAAVIAGGIVPFDRCFQERETAQIVNVDNTIRLVQDLTALRVKPVFLSSQAVYDGETGYHHEDRPRQPICEYGRQKADVERFIENDAPEALVLRLDYAVGDEPEEDHLFSRWRRWIEGNEPVPCIQGQLFSPTYVEDIAQGIELCCRLGLNGFYNLANTEFFTREELARQFVFALGCKAEVAAKPVEDFGFLDRRPLKSYLDSTKFVKATGMRFTSMREVMNSFIEKSQTAQPSALSAAGDRQGA